MKRIISVFVFTAVILGSVFQCAAADIVYRPDVDGNYSLTYEDERIVDGEDYGFIVMEGLDNQVLNLSDSSLDKILYIDDAKASDGSVTFSNFNLKGRLPSEEGFTGGTAFIGGEGFNSATTVGTLQETFVPVSDVTLDKSEATITVGESVTLTATVSPDNATSKKVTWTSSDSTVVSVDANGVIRGVAVSDSSITITASAGDKTATCTVTVVAPPVSDGKPGDANGDGTIDVLDALRICKFLANHDVTVDKDIADVNGDGTVNVLDALRICKYLANHDVTLQ